MRQRQDLIELFTTFAEFESDQFRRWAADGRLRRSMQQSLEQSEGQGSAPGQVREAAVRTEGFWALYWFRQWQQNAARLASLHLAAYVQEACFWAAQQTLKRLASGPYRLPDYFQMAIAELPTVLKGYNPDRGASLKTYASIAFPSLLRDALRQRQEADLCTPWALLRKTSKKRFLEALQWAGVAAEVVPRYRLAWLCFQMVYVPVAATGKLPPVQAGLWEAIAQRYNGDRSQLTPPAPPCTASQIEQWLTSSAHWVRAYLYPPIDSLNVPQAGRDSGDRQDLLPAAVDTSLLANLIDQEETEMRQSQHTQLQTVLTAALQTLDPQAQEILTLYYAQGLSQPQIMQQTRLSQPTVSRRLTKARENLLKALLHWSEKDLNISPNSNQIKIMSNALEEWLKSHFLKDHS